jgi:hypothetical protein
MLLKREVKRWTSVGLVRSCEVLSSQLQNDRNVNTVRELGWTNPRQLCEAVRRLPERTLVSSSVT